ncbi:MAG: hypothetical protein GY943_25520 [Chloroflexi bacterium]|nr:hypothetical protein [Chloroflexota bacterium]
MNIPLVETKLHIPQVRRLRVSRQRLIEPLNQGTHRQLTVVSAPVGFGKTPSSMKTVMIMNSLFTTMGSTRFLLLQEFGLWKRPSKNRCHIW